MCRIPQSKDGYGDKSFLEGVKGQLVDTLEASEKEAEMLRAIEELRGGVLDLTVHFS